MNDNLQTFMADVGLEGLHNWQRTLAYVLAATVCAYLGSSERLAQRTQRRVQQLWLLLSVLYLLAAASAVLQGDLLWVQWARSFARAQHAYEGRRIFQFTGLLALLLLLAAGWKMLGLASCTLTPRTLLVTGACGTLVLHGLRYVSFHYTDLALNSVWLGQSLANWVECTALGLVAAGSTLEALRSHGHV